VQLAPPPAYVRHPIRRITRLRFADSEQFRVRDRREREERVKQSAERVKQSAVFA
jgi:hypothetical protein